MATVTHLHDPTHRHQRAATDAAPRSASTLQRPSGAPCRAARRAQPVGSPAMPFEPVWAPPAASAGPAQPEPGQRASARPRVSSAVYWRRRLVAGLVLVLAGAGLWTALTWAVNSSVGVDPVGADRTGAARQQVHVVQPGDTLWSIAGRLDTDGDVRDTVDRLAARNGGSAITVGQRLVLDG